MALSRRCRQGSSLSSLKVIQIPICLACVLFLLMTRVDGNTLIHPRRLQTSSTSQTTNNNIFGNRTQLLSEVPEGKSMRPAGWLRPGISNPKETPTSLMTPSPSVPLVDQVDANETIHDNSDNDSMLSLSPSILPIEAPSPALISLAPSVSPTQMTFISTSPAERPTSIPTSTDEQGNDVNNPSSDGDTLNDLNDEESRGTTGESDTVAVNTLDNTDNGDGGFRISTAALCGIVAGGVLICFCVAVIGSGRSSDKSVYDINAMSSFFPPHSDNDNHNNHDDEDDDDGNHLSQNPANDPRRPVEKVILPSSNRSSGRRRHREEAKYEEDDLEKHPSMHDR